MTVNSRGFSRPGDFAAILRDALAWPARVVETRRALALIAQMSERERSDIGAPRAELGAGALPPDEECPSDRLARARAVRAWYGRSPCKPAACKPAA